MGINNYYFLTWTSTKEVDLAKAPEDIPLAYELIEMVKELNEMPFELNLTNGTFLDYLPNSLAWPIMSKRMKSAIDDNLKSKENISWIKIFVNFDCRKEEYYVLRFEEKLDVLDLGKTMFVPGTDQIIKPVFSIEKIREYSIFSKPSTFWQITSGIYVGEEMKKIFKHLKLEGIEFEKAAAT